MAKETVTESRTVTSEGARRVILKCFKKQRPFFCGVLRVLARVK